MATSDVEYANLEGKRIAYWSVGHGAPVVLIHGSFATSAAWKRMAAKLNADTSRAIAIDLPGWGNSEPAPLDHPALVEYEARAVEAVARQSGGGSVHLAGHSHGGTIALAVALAGRVKVLSLTLFEPLPVAILAYTGDRAVFDEVSDFVSAYRRAFKAGDRWAARSVIDMWGGSGAFEAMAPTMREFIGLGTEGNLRHWNGNFAFQPTPEELRALPIPTTVVHGSSSHRIAKLIAHRLTESMPRSRRVELGDASHFMIHTHAGESAGFVEQAIGHSLTRS
ncbi:MAG TPA: alpha/beta hydrolase [Woeseiaceae bacterium]